MIRFQCPCGQRLSAPAEDIGVRIRCNACDQLVRVPDRSDGEEPPMVEAVDEPRARDEDSRRRDRDHRRDDRDGGEVKTNGMAVASLIVSFLGLFTLALGGILAVIFGFIALAQISASKGRQKGKGLAITGLVIGGIFTLVTLPVYLYAISKVREAANRMNNASNMRQIGIAMHNYHSQRGNMPPAAICDKNGKPLLSWRVELLLNLGEEELYSQFKLDEPWDSPHNKALIPRMPKIYALPGDDPSLGKTQYKLFVGRDSWFQLPEQGINPRNRGPSLGQMAGRTSEIILLVEATEPDTWTKPGDIPFEAGTPIPPLGSYSGTTAVLMMDGAIRHVRKDCDREKLRPAISRSSKEYVDLENLR